MKQFKLGRIVATATIAERMNREKLFGDFISESFKKFTLGDWGVMSPEDQEMNNRSLVTGEGALHGSYIYQMTGEKVWIITESDRSVTTVLYPCEH